MMNDLDPPSARPSLMSSIYVADGSALEILFKS